MTLSNTSESRPRNGSVARLAGLLAIGLAWHAAGATDEAAVAAFEARLLENPVFAAIQHAAPETYAEVRSTVSAGVAQGHKTRELERAVQPYASKAIGKYLVLAEDDALLDMVGVIVAEIRVFQPYPEDC